MSQELTSTPRKSRGRKPLNPLPARSALLVLGMHRSGTSAVTRVLSLLGGELPKVIMGEGEGNDAGHWEPERLVALHDALLAEAGSRWDDFRPLSFSRTSVFGRRDVLNRVRKQVEEDYGESRFLLVKDPRISRFLPMYKTILAEMRIQPLAVIVLRNPLAVIRSLVARKAVPVHSAHYASLVWLRHVLDAERDSRSMPRVLIAYEKLIEDWRGTMSRVEEALKLDLPVSDDETGRKIDEFLSDDLAHHHSTDAALERSETVSALVKRAYASLQSLGSDGQNQTAQKELDRISVEFEAAVAGVGTAVYEEFAKRNETLKLAYDNAMNEGHGHFLRTLELQKTVDSLHGAVWQKTTEIGQLTGQATTLIDAQADAQKRAVAYSELLFEAREKASAIRDDLAKHDEELRDLRGQQQDLMGTLAELTIELTLSQDAARDAAEERSAAEALLQATLAEFERLQIAYDGREQAVAALQSALAASESRIETQMRSSLEEAEHLNQLAAQQEQELAAVRDALVDAETRADEAERRAFEEADRLQALIALRENEITAVTAALNQAESEAESSFGGEIDELKRQLSGKVQTLEKRAAHIEVQSAEIEHLRRQISNLGAQLQATKASRNWRQSRPVRAVATAFPGAVKAAKRVGRVSRYVVKGEFPDKFREWRRAKQSLRSKPASRSMVTGNPVALASPSPSPLARPAMGGYLVSVIILNYNKPELTLRSVAAVLQHSDLNAVEVIVVDNGSTYDKYEQLASDMPAAAKIIRIDVNRYFSEGNNIGAEAAQGQYVVFLNNDAFVTANWLQPMLDVFGKYPDVGGVGPKFVYPDGRLQEVGAVVSADGSVEQLGKFSLPDPSILTEVREIHYSSAACFLMERKRFLELGGFDMMYEPAYYEDVDLCFKLRYNGQKIYCTPHSTVEHLENATSGDDTNKALQLDTIVELNRKKFVARWADWFADPRATISKARLRPMAQQDEPKGRTAAIFTPYNLIPGGGERYLLQMTEVLSRHFDVVIITEHQYSAVRVREMLRDFGIPQFSFGMMLRRDITQRFELAVVLGNEALPPFGHIGHRNLYICQFPFPMTDKTVEDRRANLEKFERTIVYSDFARDCLIGAVNDIKLTCPLIDVIAPAVGGLEIPGKTLQKGGPVKILSIGRFFAGGHNKRHDVAIEATIALAKRGIPVELSLVGSVHAEAEHRARYRELVALAEGHPITFYPDAAPETVDTLLKAAHIYCHATGFGVNVAVEPHRCEHFGISVVEGMRAGAVPFVVANGGPASIVVDKVTGYHYRDMDELVNGIIELLSDSDRYARVSHAAHAAALAFDTASFQQRWENVFTAVGSTRVAP